MIFTRAIAITPGATPFAEGPCDAILVGVAGTVTLLQQDGAKPQVTLVAGQVFPFKAYGVTAAGASLLFALYR